MPTTSQIKVFSDLIAWQKAHELVLMTYMLTKSFPKEELFCLTSQMRRCSVSISSNIAEGFSRRSQNDKNHFNTMSLGSVTELQNQFFIAHDLKYIDENKFEKAFSLSIEVHKLVNSLIFLLNSTD